MEIILELINYIKLINEYNVSISIITFIVIHIIFAIFFIPCSPMTTLAGVLWGPIGVIYALIASLLSNFTTFLLSRYFLHNYFYRKFKDNKQYIWLNNMSKKYNWKLIALTQLNPIVPSSTLGYFYGLSSIKFKEYSIYTFIFSLPLNFALVFFGSSIVELLKGNFLYFILLAFMLIISIIVFRFLKRQIKLRIDKC